MVDEHGMGGHTTIQPEQCHPIAWLCYTWVRQCVLIRRMAEDSNHVVSVYMVSIGQYTYAVI